MPLKFKGKNLRNELSVATKGMVERRFHAAEMACDEKSGKYKCRYNFN